MSSRRDPEEDRVLAGFLRVYLADRSPGRPRAVQLGHRMPATRTGPYVNFAGVPGFDALLRQN